MHTFCMKVWLVTKEICWANFSIFCNFCNFCKFFFVIFVIFVCLTALWNWSQVSNLNVYGVFERITWGRCLETTFFWSRSHPATDHQVSVSGFVVSSTTLTWDTLTCIITWSNWRIQGGRSIDGTGGGGEQQRNVPRFLSPCTLIYHTFCFSSPPPPPFWQSFAGCPLFRIHGSAPGRSAPLYSS